MTNLEKLKWYMYPYYQTYDYETILDEYITTYGSVERAASALWGELPPRIASGGIKSYDTGASSTVFQDLNKITDYCRERAKHYEMVARDNETNGSIIACTRRTRVVGGANDRQYVGFDYD